MRAFLLLLMALFTAGCSSAPREAQVDPRSDPALKPCFVVENPPDQAITTCSAAIQSGKLSGRFLAAAFTLRGLGYYRKDDYDHALEDYNEALRLVPDFPVALAGRARVYDHRGESDRALLDFNQALRSQPDAGYLQERGNIYAENGDYDRAIEDYNQALKLNPKAESLFFSRGRANFYRAQYAAAQEDLSRYAAADPTYAYGAIWLFLARARAQQDARPQLAEAAKKLDPKAWPAPVVRMYLGKLSPSALMSAARDSDPKTESGQNCEAYFYLGELALMQGDQSRARGLFQKAVVTGPSTFIESVGATAELKLLTR